MAKVRGPLFSASASGSIAGELTFQPTMGGGTCRRMPTAKPAGTPAQHTQQEAMRAVRMLWDVLTGYQTKPEEDYYGITLGKHDSNATTITTGPDAWNNFTATILNARTGTLTAAKWLHANNREATENASSYFYERTSSIQDRILRAAPLPGVPELDRYAIATTALLLAGRRAGVFNNKFENYLPPLFDR